MLSRSKCYQKCFTSYHYIPKKLFGISNIFIYYSPKIGQTVIEITLRVKETFTRILDNNHHTNNNNTQIIYSARKNSN